MHYKANNPLIFFTTVNSLYKYYFGHRPLSEEVSFDVLQLPFTCIISVLEFYTSLLMIIFAVGKLYIFLKGKKNVKLSLC
jgi:hypothetical protein